jgi:glycosyltransferase involved in cell wall biosynthesis
MNENKNAKPVLSICIPAYNQPNHLRGVLASIAKALHGRKNEVEVIVHDDASPYADLRAVAGEYAEVLKIKAFRHEKNVGYDANLLGTVAAASGEYIWLLSDNDELLPEALDWFFNALNKYPGVDYIYVDRITETEPLPASGQQAVVVDTAADFITKVNLPGFMSSQVMKTALWRSIDPKPFIGSMWLHTGIILAFMPKAKVLLRSVQPLIKICTENAWVKKGKNLNAFLGLKKILDELERYGYTKEIVAYFDRKAARDLPEVLAYAKLRQLEVTPEVRAWVSRSFKHRPLTRSVAAVILSTPVAVLKFFAPPFWYFKKMFTI